MTQPMPALIGHRGLPDKAPENTRASILAAKHHGIDWVEIDVTMAGDGSLVVMHDPDLRLFGQPDVRLADIGRKELQAVDAGSWFSDEFQGEPLLFLDELLSLVSELQLGLNLEIKINDDLETNRQVMAVYETLKHADLPTHQLLVSSFNHAALAQLRNLDNNVQIAPLFKTLPQTIPASLQQLQPVSVHCSQSRLTLQQAMQYASHYPLYCYTVNSAERFGELLQWGVSGIFCDHAHAPEMLTALTFHPSE